MNYKEVARYTTESYGTVYLLTNTITGKQYVGQTTQRLFERIKNHRWHGKTAAPKTAIHRSIKKHGFENFTVDVLGHYDNQLELDAAELYFAEELGTFSPKGYNLFAGGGGGKASEETRLKIVAGLIGRVPSAKTREKHSAYRKGWHESRSPEVEAARRKKVSEAIAKTYVLRSPTGERIEVTNLKKFCADNGFTKTQHVKLALVVVGKDRSVKGWSLWIEPGQESGFRKIGYTLRSPDGKKVSIPNLKEWCVAQGYSDSQWTAMRKLVSGGKKVYLGWSVWLEPANEEPAH
jgi:group I intron endonuclease